MFTQKKRKEGSKSCSGSAFAPYNSITSAYSVNTLIEKTKLENFYCRRDYASKLFQNLLKRTIVKPNIYFICGLSMGMVETHREALVAKVQTKVLIIFLKAF